jgi:hypothetical protein
LVGQYTFKNVNKNHKIVVFFIWFFNFLYLY